MVKYIKIFSLFLIGSLIIPLLFAAQPAHAAPKDWDKIDTDEANVCGFIEDELGEVLSFEDCDESSGVEPSLSFEGASASLKTDAVSNQTWNGRFSLNTEDSDVSRGTAVYLPVCHNNGQITSAGDQIVMQESLEDGSQTYQESVRPTWDQCFIGQSPALLKIVHLEEDAFSEDQSYFPDYISNSSSSLFMRGFMYEYGIMYIIYDPTGNINGDGDWFVFLDPRKSAWEAAFPDYDFSEWVDISQIRRSSQDAYTEAQREAVNHNAELLYGEDYVYGIGSGQLRYEVGNGHSGGGYKNLNFGTNPIIAGRAYEELPPPFDMENDIGYCIWMFGGEWRFNPDASVCTIAHAGNNYHDKGIFYDSYFVGTDDNIADYVIRFMYDSPRLKDIGDYEDRNWSSSTTFDRSKVDQGSAISYSLVEPSDISISGPIVEKEREVGIDEQAIKDAGGFTTPKELTDHIVDSIPTINFTDCDLEGLGWFSCMVQLVQDVFEWIWDLLKFAVGIFIPTDLNYLAWVRAIYGGFTNSDPFYYVYGTIDYSISIFGGPWDILTVDGMCRNIESEFIDLDFCKIKGNQGYSVAMIVFSGIVYIAGFLAVFRILYGFFAPKTSVSATVSPSTAKEKN